VLGSAGDHMGFLYCCLPVGLGEKKAPKSGLSAMACPLRSADQSLLDLRRDKAITGAFADDPTYSSFIEYRK
jgi:hypothetical protein